MKKTEKAENLKNKKPSSIVDRPGYAIMLNNFAIYSIFRKLIIVAIISTITLIIGIIGITTYEINNVESKYITVNEKGSVINNVPLKERGDIQDGQIASDAIELITILNTYDYLNYKKQIIKAANYFGNEEWNNFMSQLLKSETLKLVEDEKSIVNVEIKGAPEVISRNDGPVFLWKVTVPVEVRYYPHNEKRKNILIQKANVEIFYRRVTLEENPKQYQAFAYLLKPISNY